MDGPAVTRTFITGNVSDTGGDNPSWAASQSADDITLSGESGSDSWASSSQSSGSKPSSSSGSTAISGNGSSIFSVIVLNSGLAGRVSAQATAGAGQISGALTAAGVAVGTAAPTLASTLQSVALAPSWLPNSLSSSLYYFTNTLPTSGDLHGAFVAARTALLSGGQTMKSAAFAQSQPWGTLAARLAVMSQQVSPDLAPQLPDPPPERSKDSIAAASNFFAGWSDRLTFGATGWVREQNGYDDVVNRNTSAYQAGAAVGSIQQLAMGCQYRSATLPISRSGVCEAENG